MHSALYEGTLHHARHLPKRHAFTYRVWMVYLDLAELDHAFAAHPLWSTTRNAPARFRRADYLGDPDIPLHQAVRDLVAQRTGTVPDGPIRVLTNLRTWGHCFNPVSFYYLFDAADTHVTHIVAEVTNTPWGERHAYVSSGTVSMQDKVHHVSPFMTMDGHYTWDAGTPAAALNVALTLHQHEQRVFDATLRLQRRPLDRPTMSRVLLRQAPMTLKVMLGIYSQALRLRLKGIRMQPHPRTLPSPSR